MEAYEAVIGRRAIRQFEQREIDKSILSKIADAGRLAPSAMNRQPLKFMIINTGLRRDVFSSVSWAGNLKDWNPPEDKQPAAYILLLVDPEIAKDNYEFDVGLAAEAMMIAARSFRLGSCPLYVGQNKRIRELLEIGNLVPTIMVALGYPAEESVAEDESGSLSYCRDSSGLLHVPKRKKEDVIFFKE